jgi:hypothetical protein
MDPHAPGFAEWLLVGLGASRDATRQHIDSEALAYERLGELAHVPGEAALDNRRILP